MIPNTLTGLTSGEAAQRLSHDGYNELSKANKHSFLFTLKDVLLEPMVLLLLACGGVYFAFGDVREAIILLASVVLVIGITLIQERKTENALEALRKLSSPRANVIRDGALSRIPGREVVRGDLLLLEEGDRIPADALLVTASELHVDESLLTGESVPVAKPNATQVYASTLVIRGRGYATVQATGRDTQVGKIGQSLDVLSAAHSPLRREIQHLVKILSIIAIGLCLLTIIAVGLLRSGWREGFLAGLTLAMSLLPEEFPVVLTIFFAIGAYRLSRARVLTRHLPAIEALGSANVLCADKTGTMTENKMRITHFMTANDDQVRRLEDPWDSAGRRLASVGALACPLNSFDPVDQATVEFGSHAPDEGIQLRAQPPVREYPLSAERLMVGEVRQTTTGLFIAVKGAPEAVMNLCRVGPEELSKLDVRLRTLAAEGLRIIAVAQALCPNDLVPENLNEVTFEFLGLLGMMDPIRPGVSAAVKECRSAGVRVLMITGDYPQTAAIIAQRAGLRETACLTGAEMDRISDDELRRRMPLTDLFARVTPSHKLRLVQVLRSSDAIVAMTGDGVNDAPALKAAHIGIAMGGRGTDVAREAADLVVLDDNFVSIVGAIRMGRRIYANLQKSIAYLVAVHVPIAGMALVPILFGWPLFFMPVHIVFLELIIDPACSLVFEGEAEDADLMRKPPRPHNSALLNTERMFNSVINGVMVLIVTACVFGIGLRMEAGVTDARTLAFTTLVLGNLLLILINRSQTQEFWTAILLPNRAWLAVTLGTLAAMGVILYVPAIRPLFQFSVLHPHDLSLLVAAIGSLVALFFLAWLTRYYHPRSSS